MAKNPAGNILRAVDTPCRSIDSQVVLVLQGGGALGAFQAGVAQALIEADIDIDWIAGTSIGAINAALIAGNPPERRIERMRAFWDTVAIDDPIPALFGFHRASTTARAVFSGVPGFYTPQPASWLGPFARTTASTASYYSIEPLRETLRELIDFDRCGQYGVRLTVGAVGVRDGRMRYFDSRDEAITVEHVLASGALPPAFPAIPIDGELYWDGGIASNTPIETVFDDARRRSSVVFAAQVWNPGGADPDSLWGVMTRQKDIQYASKARNQILLQERLHHLRHIIRQLEPHIAPAMRDDAQVRELLSWGCSTSMHFIPIRMPRSASEDHTKDVDFSGETLRRRWSLGYEMAQARIADAPWTMPIDPAVGVLIHESPEG